MSKLCREARQRMQILTYFSLLAERGHEAAAIAAPQAQEMSRSPAKISAVMPLPDAGCLQGRGNHPSARATRPQPPGPAADVVRVGWGL